MRGGGIPIVINLVATIIQLALDLDFRANNAASGDAAVAASERAIAEATLSLGSVLARSAGIAAHAGLDATIQPGRVASDGAAKTAAGLEANGWRGTAAEKA